MRVALVFNRMRPDTIGIYFERACRALGVEVESWWLRDVQAIPAGYDLYVRIDHGDDYEATWPAQAHPAIFYAIDTHLAHSWRKIRRTAARYDLVFCAQRAATLALSGAEWLPLGCDPTWAEDGVTGGPWDVASIGTDGGLPRKFILQALRERYPRSRIGSASHTQLMPIYRRAKIGVNYSIRGELNMRVFEVLGAGALLLTNPLPEDDLEALGLREGEHLVLYRHVDELVPTIERFLTDEAARQRIAGAGREQALARHTYVHRMKRVLDVASMRLGLGAQGVHERISRAGASCASS